VRLSNNVAQSISPEAFAQPSGQLRLDGRRLDHDEAPRLAIVRGGGTRGRVEELLDQSRGDWLLSITANRAAGVEGVEEVQGAFVSGR
jgi:hypothetical protein